MRRIRLTSILCLSFLPAFGCLMVTDGGIGGSTGAEEGATPVLGWSDLGGDATYELAGRTERSNITIDAGTVTATYD